MDNIIFLLLDFFVPYTELNLDNECGDFFPTGPNLNVCLPDHDIFDIRP